MEYIDRDGLIPCRTFDLDSKLHGESDKAIARARIEIISDEQGAEDIAALDSEILEWLHVNEGNVLPMHVKYIKKHLEKTRENPSGYAYQLYKLHKKTIDTRLVVSDCGSLIHALGKWVNEMLQCSSPSCSRRRPTSRIPWGVDKPSTGARPHPKQREYLHVRRHQNVSLDLDGSMLGEIGRVSTPP
ncbi:hypothetical protein THAOC_10026 [Thalassiosira oceanica]|uniref:Uncharacterized protein n=1 Tax=Thalassiosira oceanica TaxID=159749 RepID=K0T651_THAOC|nr:hypothetical protein THAOC_10026 [Thalassiosira oceanica]|eukprot:EJK68766.1 hypothetical protein THAOC_10026 [Thalassiosira oceanica]